MEPHHTFSLLYVSGLREIILLGELGVEDLDNCLRYVPIVLHMTHFCEALPDREFVDRHEEHSINWSNKFQLHLQLIRVTPDGKVVSLCVPLCRLVCKVCGLREHTRRNDNHNR